MRPREQVGLAVSATLNASSCSSALMHWKSIWRRWTACARAFTCATRSVIKQVQARSLHFADLLQRVRHDTTKIPGAAGAHRAEVEALETRRAPPRMRFEHPDAAGAAAVPAAPPPAAPVPAAGTLAGPRPALAGTPTPAPFVRNLPKVGRNEPCPCGSGKKYKHCHALN
jgi:preprotein translocase subunit SecA